LSTLAPQGMEMGEVFVDHCEQAMESGEKEEILVDGGEQAVVSGEEPKVIVQYCQPAMELGVRTDFPLLTHQEKLNMNNGYCPETESVSSASIPRAMKGSLSSEERPNKDTVLEEEKKSEFECHMCFGTFKSEETLFEHSVQNHVETTVEIKEEAFEHSTLEHIETTMEIKEECTVDIPTIDESNEEVCAEGILTIDEGDEEELLLEKNGVMKPVWPDFFTPGSFRVFKKAFRMRQKYQKANLMNLTLIKNNKICILTPRCYRTGVDMFKCTKCPKSFFSEVQMADHEDYHERGIPESAEEDSNVDSDLDLDVDLDVEEDVEEEVEEEEEDTESEYTDDSGEEEEEAEEGEEVEEEEDN